MLKKFDKQLPLHIVQEYVLLSKPQYEYPSETEKRVTNVIMLNDVRTLTLPKKPNYGTTLRITGVLHFSDRKYCSRSGYLVGPAVVQPVPVHSLMTIVTEYNDVSGTPDCQGSNGWIELKRGAFIRCDGEDSLLCLWKFCYKGYSGYNLRKQLIRAYYLNCWIYTSVCP